MNNVDKSPISEERVRDFQAKFTALQAETNIQVVAGLNYLEQAIVPVLALVDTTPKKAEQPNQETIKAEAEVVEGDKAA